ncbi:MAG TPA: magnesium transporter [Thermodesulfobacteriota bacterium]|nr:magnesium transporter [Thermodesulfobacteriota bacterium]
METNTSILPFVNKFFEYDPAVAAHILETMTEAEAVAILSTIPTSLSANVLRYLPVSQAIALLKEVPNPLFKEIVEKLDPQLGAAIFVNIPPPRRKSFLDHLSEKAKSQIQELLTYPENSVGRIMTTDFVAFHTDIKVEDAIQKIRWLAHTKDPHSYVYAVDTDNRLVGVLNMRDLLLASPDATLESAMRKEVFSLNAFTDRKEAANELSKRKYFAAPVVDNENRLVGLVQTEQLLSQVQERATEDLQKMFGAGGSERAFSTIGFSLKRRLPWLHINLVTVFLAASVVAMFESTIAQITVLAVFLPIVSGESANAGSQSLAVVMRGLAMREIPAYRVKRLILKEGGIGVLNGLIIGTVTGIAAWVWRGNPFLGIVIALTMVVNLVVAGLSGALIPITMKAIGRDPAQSSCIILTTVTDVVGFLVFLGFAVLFKSYLI